MNFKYSDKTGVICEEIHWIPGPYFLARRRAVVDIIDELVDGFRKNIVQCPSVLEMGFGTGVLTYEFFKKGFKCQGYDIGIKQFEIANSLFKEEIIDTDRLKFVNKLVDGDKKKFDIVAAFEVLEHIEDDVAALQEWKSYLKDNGKIFLSVPCHMKKFGNEDKGAGHLRRYEKVELVNLLEKAGFSIDKFYCIGFPLMTFTLSFMNKIHYKKKHGDVEKLSIDEKTKRSGYDREREYKLKWINKNIIWFSHFFATMQKLFYKKDWGTNYVVLAEKISN